MKKIAIGSILVFVLWFGLEWVIHGQLLKPIYDSTKQMWRPEADVNMALYMAVTLLVAVAVTAVYAIFVSEKSLRRAILFGAVLGFGMAVSHAYIDYVFMPMPYELALSWFLALWFEVIAAGVVLGLVIRD